MSIIIDNDFLCLYSYISCYFYFSKIRESLYRLDVTNLKASDIDTEYSSCGDNNIVLKDSPNSKYKPEFKPFEGLHFIITYSKFKRSGEEQKKGK